MVYTQAAKENRKKKYLAKKEQAGDVICEFLFGKQLRSLKALDYELGGRELESKELEMITNRRMGEISLEQIELSRERMYIQIEKERLELDNLRTDRTEIDLKLAEIERLKAETETIYAKIFIDKLIAETQAESLRAETDVTRVRVKLLNKLKDEIDLKEITPSQAFVLAKGFNPQDSSNVAFAMEEKMFEENLYKAKQQNRMHKADADLRENYVNSTIGKNENSRGGFGND